MMHASIANVKWNTPTVLHMYVYILLYTLCDNNFKCSNEIFFYYAERCVCNYKKTHTIANRLYDIQRGKLHRCIIEYII